MGRRKDPLSRQKLAFARARAQARFRDEGWEFTLEQWRQAWAAHWEDRGMQADQYCMIRLCHSRPWSPENTEIVRRREYLSPTRRYYHLGKKLEEEAVD